LATQYEDDRFSNEESELVERVYSGTVTGAASMTGARPTIDVRSRAATRKSVERMLTLTEEKTSFCWMWKMCCLVEVCDDWVEESRLSVDERLMKIRRILAQVVVTATTLSSGDFVM